MTVNTIINIVMAVASSIGVFIAVWLVVITALRQKAKMKPKLDIDPGVELNRSKLGTAKINEVVVRRCAYLVEYDKGWVMGMKKRFGGGVIFLPKGETVVGELKTKGWLIPLYKTRTLVYADHVIELTGKLAKFIEVPGDYPA